jgi:hypothetical protein
MTGRSPTIAIMSEPNEPMRDEFLSEEDLDLRNLSFDELLVVWQQWLEQAQATNDLDARTYSHGVFEIEPEAVRVTRPSRSNSAAPDPDESRPS